MIIFDITKSQVLARMAAAVVRQQPYDLDSVCEDKLNDLISQLGLKKHSHDKMEPSCVICREHLAINQSHSMMMQRAPVLVPINYVPIYPYPYFVRR